MNHINHLYILTMHANLDFFLYDCPDLHNIPNSRSQSPVNHPILLLSPSLRLSNMLFRRETIIRLYILNMKFNLDLFHYDCYNLHETQEIPMELLYSLCSSHTPVFYWDFHDLLEFLQNSIPSGYYNTCAKIAPVKTLIQDFLLTYNLLIPLSHINCRSFT